VIWLTFGDTIQKIGGREPGKPWEVVRLLHGGLHKHGKLIYTDTSRAKLNVYVYVTFRNILIRRFSYIFTVSMYAVLSCLD